MVVSKSLFQSGLVCTRRAYYDVHSPELAKAPSVAERERMAAGQEVGRLARRLAEGVLVTVPSYDMERAAEETRRAIEDGASVVYEAAFATPTAHVRVDVLRRLEDGSWEIVEVKSSKAPKDAHFTDLAFQTLVAQECGLSVASVKLLLVSETYVFPGGDLVPGDFFKELDVTGDVLPLLDAARESLALQLTALHGAEPPAVVPNVHCRRDGECPYLSQCWHSISPFDATTLPYIKADVVHELHALGSREISRIPEGVRLTVRQRLIADVVRSGVPYVSEKLAEDLGAVAYPVHFLDFEACSSAIPDYPGVAPYRHVPFQWSDHVMERDGTTTHREFLHRDRSDPREAFSRSLYEAIKDAGTVCTYSSYEQSILKNLNSDGTPLASEALQVLMERGLDLEKVVRDRVYLPEFHGRTSIKKVYPALVPEATYRDLSIQDGDTAAAEFRRMVSPATTADQVERIATDLLAYCGRDTQAMVEVFQALQRLALSPSGPNP
jgi:hypothetical protein